MTKEKLDSEIDRIVYADHNDPFAILGMHKQLIDATEKLVVRAFLPQARKVGVVDSETGELVIDLPQVRQQGLFMGVIPGRKQAFRYRLRLLPYGSEITYDIEDTCTCNSGKLVIRRSMPASAVASPIRRMR